MHHRFVLAPQKEIGFNASDIDSSYLQPYLHIYYMYTAANLATH